MIQEEAHTAVPSWGPEASRTREGAHRGSHSLPEASAHSRPTFSRQRVGCTFQQPRLSNRKADLTSSACAHDVTSASGAGCRRPGSAQARPRVFKGVGSEGCLPWRIWALQIQTCYTLQATYLCMCVHLREFTCTVCLQEPTDSVWHPGDCESPRGCWEPKRDLWKGNELLDSRDISPTQLKFDLESPRS